MSVLEQLSSRVGDRTQASNVQVAARCAANPTLLAEVAEGLGDRNAALAGDCAEVMTKVAEANPKLVTPYAERLAPLLAHRTTRVRWETAHALALVAPLASQVIAPVLPRLLQMVRSDGSTIVRDYVVDAVAGFAGVDGDAARAAYPVLRDALELWGGKHAHHALNGLANVAAAAPELRGELLALAQQYLGEGRAAVRRSAKSLLRASRAG